MEDLANTTAKGHDLIVKIRQQWAVLPNLIQTADHGMVGILTSMTKFGRDMKGMGKIIMEMAEQGFKNTQLMGMELDSTINKLAEAQAALAEANGLLAEGLKKGAGKEALMYMERERDMLTRKVEDLETVRDVQEGMYLKAVDHNMVLAEMDKINFSKRLSFLTGEISLIAQALWAHRAIQRTLIETNALHSKRMEYQLDILKASIEQGVSMDESQDAAQVLSTYGLELSGRFRENVKFVNMMKEGLGVSADESAKMVVIWGGRLNHNVREIGTLISRVVDDTGLAAAKAADYANQIGRAFANLKKGSVSLGQQKELTDFILRLEAAQQQVTGVSGDWAAMFKKMNSSVEGIQQAAMLGINMPEHATPEAIAAGLERVSIQLNSLGNRERIAAAEQYARVLGVSADTLLSYADVARVMRENNTQRKSLMDIEERWRVQSELSEKAIMRLLGTVRALLVYGLTPVAHGVAWFAGKLNDFLQWVASSKVALGTSMVVMSGIVVIAAREIWALSRAVIALGLSARAATHGIAANGVTGWFQNLVSTMKAGPAVGPPLPPGHAAAAAGWLSQLKTLVTTPLTWTGILASSKAGLAAAWSGITGVVQGAVSKLWSIFGVMGAVVTAAAYGAAKLWQEVGKRLSDIRQLENDVLRSQIDHGRHITGLIRERLMSRALIEKDTEKLQSYFDKQFGNIEASGMSLTDQIKAQRQIREDLDAARNQRFAEDQVSNDVKTTDDLKVYAKMAQLQEQSLAEAKKLSDKATEQRKAEEAAEKAAAERFLIEQHFAWGN